MKICRMMFYSDYISDEQLVKAVQNSSHLDKCYVGFYSKTWTGEKHQKINLNLFNNLSDYSKNVRLVYFNEENAKIDHSFMRPMQVDAACRNYLIEIAKSDRQDIMIMQDTDEFIIQEEYEKIINEYFPAMIEFGFNCCAMKWKNFWKNWRTILEPNINTLSDPPFEWTNFAMMLNSNIKFTSSKYIKQDGNKSSMQQEWYLYHGSFVLSDEQVLNKVTTWGHSKDIDMLNWYREKWLKWDYETTDLHPSENPHHWLKAVPYDGPLPKELIDYKV